MPWPTGRDLESLAGRNRLAEESHPLPQGKRLWIVSMLLRVHYPSQSSMSPPRVEVRVPDGAAAGNCGRAEWG